MPTKVHKLILSTQDKLPHESHSDCTINLHAPINKATGFRVCSSHIPVDQGTFTFYENTLEYQLSSNYTFPNIKKIQFIVTNTDTRALDLNATILLPNATYTNTALNTLFTNNFIYSGINSWNVTSNTITADFNAATYNRTAELIAYNHKDEKTSHDFLNIDFTPKVLPHAETFNDENNKFEYVFEEMFTFPKIRRIVCKYDDPTTGSQLTAKLDLNDQIPVFNITQFLAMLNTAFATPLLATFTSNHTTATNLDSIILTGTGSDNARNRLINLTAYDQNFDKIENDGHLNLKSIDIMVPAGQVMGAKTITTQTNPAGKLSFDFSALNTVAFNANQVYTSQEIVDQLNTLDEPANTAITFAKTGDVLSIENDTPNLAKTFLYIKKIQLQISTGSKSIIQFLDFDDIPDNLNADSFIVYLNMFLTGKDLAGSEPGQTLSYDITGNTLSVVPASYHQERVFKFTAFDDNDQPTTTSGLNFPGTEFEIAANSSSAANITTNILFTSTTGVADTYANTTLTPRGKMSYHINDTLGFIKGSVVINTGNVKNADKAMTLANGSDVDINFTTTMDISTKNSFNNVISKITFDPFETYTEASLLTFLNGNFAHFTWSFDDHRLKVVSSNSSSHSNVLRLFRNEKLGIVFKKLNINSVDVPVDGAYTAEAVLNGSTHIMCYLGLSIYNDSVCSKKNNQAHASDICATLHNRSRMTYGDYLEQNNESTDIIPISTSQFQSIRVRSYNPNFQLIPNQHLPTHVELNIFTEDY